MCSESGGLAVSMPVNLEVGKERLQDLCFPKHVLMLS